MSDQELNAIAQRNAKRRKLKAAATSGPWMYESWATVMVPQRAPRSSRPMIVIRPEAWFQRFGDTLGEYGLDEGTDLKRMRSCVAVAEYIAESRNDEVETDVDALVAEVRRLRGL